MNSIAGHMTLDKVARITGGLYLAYIVASVLATALAAQDDGVFDDEDGAVQWLERYLVAQ